MNEIHKKIENSIKKHGSGRKRDKKGAIQNRNNSHTFCRPWTVIPSFEEKDIVNPLELGLIKSFEK